MTLGDKICQSVLNIQEAETTITNISISKEGRIIFLLPISGLRSKNNSKLLFDLSSAEQFYIDTVGALVVRKFLYRFFKVLQSFSDSDYDEKFIQYNHLHFSIETKGEFLEFTFHVSFLHDIILGNFITKTEKE